MSLTKTYLTTVAGSGNSTTIAATGLDTSSYTHLVVHVKHEGAATTIATADNKGSGAYNAETKVDHANGDMSSRILWQKIGTPGTSTTVTTTFGATRGFRIMHVWGVNASGGTAEKDAAAQTSGSSTAVDAGTLSTTGVSVVSFFGTGYYNNGITNPSAGWGEDYDSNSLGVQGWAASRGPETTTPIDPAATWATNDAWTANSLSLREPAAGALELMGQILL